MVSWRPAGLILSGRHHTPGTIELLRSATIPVVEIWDLTTSPIDMAVGFSHADCGAEMARHLLARGRRKAGYVGALARAGHPLVDSEMLHNAPGFYAGSMAWRPCSAERTTLMSSNSITTRSRLAASPSVSPVA
ncbi:MAG: hypothetical protein ACK4UW_03675 [Rhizobium rhizophilum]|uniref:hypothetical protein n=1 Tax=Rhizobium rhizophilum TaxID=1850373 RepID=UPI00391DB9D8